MSDHIFHSIQDAPSLTEEDIVSANSDITHLLPYFSLGNQEFMESFSDPYSLYDRFGVTAEELEYILQHQ